MKPNEYWDGRLRRLKPERQYSLFNSKKRRMYLSWGCDRDCKTKNVSFHGRYCYECPLMNETTLLKKMREIVPSRDTFYIGREWEEKMKHKRGPKHTLEGVAKKMGKSFVPFSWQWGWFGETAEEVISDIKDRHEERYFIFLYMTEFM